MGLFDKLKKKDNDFKTICEEMGKEFLELYLKETNTLLENISELERQVLSVYFFGMSDALRQSKTTDSNANEIALIIMNTLVNVFKYSKDQSEQFFYSMIENLQSKDSKNTHYAIIHRGVEGYFAWEKGEKISVIKDVCQIVNLLKG